MYLEQFYTFVLPSSGIMWTSKFVKDGYGKIWKDEMQCTGTESRLINCSFHYYHNCGHNEDVGIDCDVTCPQSGNDYLCIQYFRICLFI